MSFFFCVAGSSFNGAIDDQPCAVVGAECPAGTVESTAPDAQTDRVCTPCEDANTTACTDATTATQCAAGFGLSSGDCVGCSAGTTFSAADDANERDELVRLRATEALWEAGKKDLLDPVPLLERQFTDRSERLRLSAVRMLRKFGSPGAADALGRALLDKSLTETVRLVHLRPRGVGQRPLQTGVRGVRGTGPDWQRRWRRHVRNLLHAAGPWLRRGVGRCERRLRQPRTSIALV